jgi:iron-sulfur cluster assembly accessory protein
MIHFSQAAITEINRLKHSRDQPDAWVRLSVKPGGCLQLYYNLDLVDRPHPSDRVFQYEHLWVAVDDASVPAVDGVTIDYTEDLMGGGFRFRNPNAQQDCGCGNSFTIEATDDRSDMQDHTVVMDESPG